MGWHTVAGVLQLVIMAYFLVTHWTSAPPSTRTAVRARDTVIYLVPMAALAAGTLADVRGAVVVSAVFYSVWLLNNLFSWWVPYFTGWPHGLARREVRVGKPIVPVRRGRPTPDLPHTVIGVLLVVVVIATWYAAVGRPG